MQWSAIRMERKGSNNNSRMSKFPCGRPLCLRCVHPRFQVGTSSLICGERSRTWRIYWYCGPGLWDLYTVLKSEIMSKTWRCPVKLSHGFALVTSFKRFEKNCTCKPIKWQQWDYGGPALVRRFARALGTNSDSGRKSPFNVMTLQHLYSELLSISWTYVQDVFPSFSHGYRNPSDRVSTDGTRPRTQASDSFAFCRLPQMQ